VRRILIYGACHAQVIRDLLVQILPKDEFDLSLLVNFQLIASGMPFPYADLKHYDAVIYSPIENQGSYNTEALREACAAAGCVSIRYSWLEWHGYWPGARKGLFKGRPQWHYPQLQVLAENFSNFDDFHNHVVENFPDDETIHQVFESSTAKMRAFEARHEVEVRVSNFVNDQFRSSRLFQMPDHPSLKLYEQVIAQILPALGISLAVALPSEEPQGHLRPPIFPRVAHQLGLTFSNTDWVDQDVLPGVTWDFRTYLRLYYYPDSVILGPLENARIFSRHAPDSRKGLPAASATRLFAQPAEPKASDEIQDYELLAILAGPELAPDFLKTFAINPADWRSTWIF
jgi:hypothetical protein